VKQLRFAPEAEARLDAISEWTLRRFGPRQAKKYLLVLRDRCARIAAGTAHHQSCRDVFAPEAREDLRFARSGEHYVIFVETAREALIVDFIHSRMDLPGCVEGLGAAGLRNVECHV
jgi:plasmid stabilization system protein ParE